MIEIKIINELSGKKFGQEFETMEAAQAFINRGKNKNSWGKPERWIKSDDLPTELVDRIIETKLDDEGNTVSKVKPDYVIQIIDEESDQEFKNKMNELRQAKEMPTLQEKVDALIEGGQKLADLKQAIATVKAKYPVI